MYMLNKLHNTVTYGHFYYLRVTTGKVSSGSKQWETESTQGQSALLLVCVYTG